MDLGNVSGAERLRFCVLGGFEMTDGLGRLVAFERPFAARLLRYLLAAEGLSRTGDEILDAFWPERPADEARATLHVAVHRVRRALGPDRLARREAGYGLVLREADEFDAAVFAARAAAALSTSGRSRRAALEDALAAWGGEPYAEDRYEDWAWGAREQLLDLRRMCQSELIELHLGAGDTARAILAARTLVAADEIDEGAHLALIRALAAAGRRDDALAQLAQCRRTLLRRLGTELSPHTVKTARAVLCELPARRSA